MKLDADKYRLNVPAIKDYIKDKSDKELLDAVGVLAIATNVPVIIVAHFIQELRGDVLGLQALKERLMVFYHIEEILCTK